MDNSKDLADNVERAAQAAKVMRFQIDIPETEIFDPSDEINELLNAEFMQNQMDIWRSMIDLAEDYSHRLEMIAAETGEATTDLTNFVNLGIQGFDRLIWQGERLSNIWKSMGRQLAKRGMFALLTGGFGEAAGGFKGGIKSILGINDGIISPRGDLITTHPDDYLIATKDPGKMAANIQGSGGGNGISVNQLVQALNSVNWEIKGDSITVAGSRGAVRYNR